MFRSSVFRIVLSSSIGVLLVLLCLCWSVFFFWRAQVLEREKALISLEAESAAARFARGGLARIAEDIALEDELIWHPDWLYFALEEEQFIFRLVGEPLTDLKDWTNDRGRMDEDERFFEDEQDEDFRARNSNSLTAELAPERLEDESEEELEAEDLTAAGYPYLYADWEWGDAELDHEDLHDHEIISYRLFLDDEHSLIIARFYPEILIDWAEPLLFSTIVLLFTLLPLSVLTAFWLQRAVKNRLQPLADTAAAVGEGTLDKRVPRQGSGDEFDQLAKAFNGMLDRVATLTRNMRNVSVGVAHDLKTPVSNIDGRLQLIERDIANPDLVTEHLERSREHIANLQRTLDALLRLGEIEAGARRSAFTLVDLSTLCTDLVESFSPVLAEMDKTLNCDIAKGLLAYGDPDLLMQLVINLLENIGEHARDGANAWLQLQRSGEELLLIVGDDGPGIAEPLREVLFERFVQLDASRQASGNGLGLSIVRAIAELHHGTVNLRSDTRGAVFEVRIPSSRSGSVPGSAPYKSV